MDSNTLATEGHDVQPMDYGNKIPIYFAGEPHPDNQYSCFGSVVERRMGQRMRGVYLKEVHWAGFYDELKIKSISIGKDPHIEFEEGWWPRDRATMVLTATICPDGDGGIVIENPEYERYDGKRVKALYYRIIHVGWMTLDGKA